MQNFTSRGETAVHIARVSALASLLSAAVLTDNREQVLHCYRHLLSELSSVGYALAGQFDLRAEKAGRA